MTIRVLSFDFDGCLVNQAYAENRDIIASNQQLLDAIKENNTAFDKIYTFNGSNRQSWAINQWDENKVESCFPAMQRISQYLNVDLDTFLLADVFGNLEPGTSFQRATNKNYRGSHADWTVDMSKAIILYAQIHKIACEHACDRITYDFYDDDKSKIRELSTFYHRNAHLIPCNVTLRLNHYAGADMTLIGECQGRGFIDENYYERTKALTNQAKVVSENEINVARYASPLELTVRKELNITLADALKEITDKYLMFDAKAKQHFDENQCMIEQSSRYYHYKNAAKATSDFKLRIDTALYNYFIDNNEQQLRAAVDNATNWALNSELKNYRGHLKEILWYTSLALLAVLTVATAGIALVTAAGINRVVNGPYSFFSKPNTDSVNCIYQVKNELEKFIPLVR